MTWVILGIVLLIVALVAFSGAKQVPWADKLQRLHAGSRRAEWIAPDYVLQQVRNDYLMAVRWQRESVFLDWATQMTSAPQYLTGQHLQRYQKITLWQRFSSRPRYTDILRAEHFVEVRHFSEDGERCYVIDTQTNRSISTHDYWTREIIIAQRVEDAALVYIMVYDKPSHRWKIEQFVQQLPPGWRSVTGRNARRVKLLSAFTPDIGRTIGRDH